MAANLPKIMTKSGPDDFQTPPIALKPLLPYIPKDWHIWECAEGKGNLKYELHRLGYSVIGTDIKDGAEGYDFFMLSECSFIDTIDCIITNPPFSRKNEWIERCYHIGKPFALLLPLSALETTRRQNCWRRGVQLIVLNKRLHFETPDNGVSYCWFASAWFTHKLKLPNDIMFGTL